MSENKNFSVQELVNNKGEKIKQFTICGTNCCCPTLEINGSDFILKDDFGGKITLNKKQIKTLQQIPIK